MEERTTKNSSNKQERSFFADKQHIIIIGIVIAVLVSFISLSIYGFITLNNRMKALEESKPKERSPTIQEEVGGKRTKRSSKPVALDTINILGRLRSLEERWNQSVGHQPAFILRGPLGRPGRDGIVGRNGIAGRDGTPGRDGRDGKDSPKGAKGDLGKRGDRGAEGIPGNPGMPGIDGAKGEVGQEGLKGVVGFPGITGEQGKQGNPGAKGEQGSTGEIGIQGEQGQDGETGMPGGKGEHGFPGQKGGIGEVGQEGYPGIKGVPGETGLVGERGFEGIPGEQGNDGRQGADGFPGEKGDKGIQGETGLQGSPGVTGVSYIRWGKKSCPNTRAKLVYEGYVGGSEFAEKGGAANYVCLTKKPIYKKFQEGIQTNGSWIYGAKYASQSLIFPNSINYHDVPCALCHVDIRATQMMIPGRNVCPAGWTREYKGYLMAERHDHHRTMFTCVDENQNPDYIGGTGELRNGALFYFVKGVCGALPCKPYVGNRKLTCAVCTR